MRGSKQRREPWAATYMNPGTMVFWAFHLVAIAGVIALGFSWSGLILAVSFYFGRMFFISAGYHRYFSHRAYKTSRPVQFVLALGAQTALQRGVLWWSAKHRHHHKFSDLPGDVHSPLQDGFWWSHIGWSTSNLSNGADYSKIPDLTRYRELRFLDDLKHWPAIALAVILFAVGGVHALIWGFFASTVLLWHGTFTINSLSHIVGRRRYETTDTSRNNWALALITLGEGWHNNHHYYMSSANQGFRWYEIDLSYYILRGLSAVGLVWDVRKAPQYIVDGTVKAHAAALAAETVAPTL